jgi:alpha-methylacyl-CoA racemase
MKAGDASGPLRGLRIVEFAGIGPGPFCGMLLSDLGADVLTIDRKGGRPPSSHAISQRGRYRLSLDLKQSAAVELCLRLIERSEALFEGFRPGVMERLGLGPEVALKRNPALVYGRMTGWGQSGPCASAAGHDINYIALSGALHAIGVAEKPVPPLNLVGDFGGGALYLALGLLAGVMHARNTGRGQVVDAAMTDGAASLMAMFYGFKAGGQWQDVRQANRLDGGAHFYDTYQCADGKWIAVGAIEPQFYALLLDKLGLQGRMGFEQLDREHWPHCRERLAQVFRARTRDEWCGALEGTDACFAPVLTLEEAPRHPHNRARGTFVELDGVTQPAPAPRFSATPGRIRHAPAASPSAEEILRRWSVPASALGHLGHAG